MLFTSKTILQVFDLFCISHLTVTFLNFAHLDSEMSFDFKRFGTRITLSERFAIIRNEALKQAATANHSLETNLTPNVAKKTANGTFPPVNRPQALLTAGSERNRQLVLKMDKQASVLQGNNNRTENNIRQDSHLVKTNSTPTNRPKTVPRVNVKQRLGIQTPGITPAISKSTIRNRLGKIPINQRIGQVMSSNRGELL